MTSTTTSPTVHTTPGTRPALWRPALVPDLVVAASLGTRFALMTMHLTAAIIVIPVIASRLSDRRR